MATLISGIVALVLSGCLWAYLRVRTRHLECGVDYLSEFGELAQELAGREMPERELKNLVLLTHYTGTGHIAGSLFHQLVTGNLAATPSRDAISARRKEWSGYNSATRVLYVRTFFSAIRADSYFSGAIRGTLFRRAVFYLNADPAEIAKAVEAMETKILLLGTERAVEREVRRNPEPECRDKELARA